MNNRILSVLLGIALLPVAASAEVPQNPRYIAFILDDFRDHEPSWFTADNIAASPRSVNAPENPELRVAVMATFSVLNFKIGDEKTLTDSVRNYLKASQESKVPVFVMFEGLDWWEARPDLWNWWDKSKPGYSPDNVNNVEWTGWDPSFAVKISWLNWGRQTRRAPAPNIASPRVLDATSEKLKLVIPIVAEWYAQLPSDQKYLLGGVKLGQEVGIGYNAYYYPHGNTFLEKWPGDPSHDPEYDNRVDHKLGWPCGIAPLGYNALKTSGIKTSGPINVDDIGKVVQRYLARLCKETYELGIPREKIYSHSGGNYPPFDQHIPYGAAFNEWATPAWSFYFRGPQESGDVAGYLKRAGRTKWAASDGWWAGQSPAEWENNLERILRFEDCRLVGIYYPEAFAKGPFGAAAVREVVKRWKDNQADRPPSMRR